VILERGAEVRTGEEVPVRASESVLDQLLRSLRVRDAGVELRDLLLGQPSPPPTLAAASSRPISASVKPASW
jgi:hypothetical protein